MCAENNTVGEQTEYDDTRKEEQVAAIDYAALQTVEVSHHAD